MGKTNHKKYLQENKRFTDGYGIASKKKEINKSSQKRFKRAIKTNNIDELLNIEDLE